MIQTVVVGVAESDRIFAARVVEVDDPASITLDWTEDTRLYALGFTQPHRELQLTPGELPLIDPNQDGTTSLDTHGPLQSLLRVSAESEWVEAAEVNPLGSIRHPFQSDSVPCGVSAEEIESFSLDRTGSRGSLLVLDDERILVLAGESEDEIWMFDRAGVKTRVPSPETGSVVLSSASGRRDGEPKLALVGSKLFEVSWTGARVELSAFSTAGSAPEIVELLTFGTRIYAVSRDGVFLELVGDEWVSRFEFNPVRISSASMIVTPDDDVVVSTPKDLPLLVWDGSTARTTTTGLDRAPLGLAYSEDLGLIMGDGFGQMWHQVGDRFEEIGNTQLSLGINSIAITHRGFIFSANNGYVGQYVDGRFCPPLHPAYAGLDYIRTWGPDFVMRTRSAGSARIDVVILPRIPRG